jgi:hypothetical protein
MLGAQHNPFVPGGDPNAPQFAVKNLDIGQGLSLDRLDDRRSLNRHFDAARRQFDGNPTTQATDKFNQEAFEFVLSRQGVKAILSVAGSAGLAGVAGR